MVKLANDESRDGCWTEDEERTSFIIAAVDAKSELETDTIGKGNEERTPFMTAAVHDKSELGTGTIGNGNGQMDGIESSQVTEVG